MIAPYPLAGQLAGEQTHVECEKNSLFSSHPLLCPELDFRCFERCVACHQKMVPRELYASPVDKLVESLPAGNRSDDQERLFS